MTEASPHFVLPARLDSSTATTVAEGLKPLRGRDLDLCGFDVERVGGQGLQVLLAAFKTWAQDGHALRIVDPSPAFCSGLEALGFPFRAPLAEELSQ